MYQYEIDKAINLKRSGDFDGANQIYIELNEKCPNDPDIIMSWAKIYICLGKYDIAIEKYKLASSLFQKFGRNNWMQCEAQVEGIKNRFNEPDRFKDFVVAVSGNSISRKNIILWEKKTIRTFLYKTY